MNKQISILGCGWLGFPLAKALLQEGYSVHGATTSESKLATLESSGIKPFQIELNADGVQGDIQSFLNASEILIVNIPPRRSQSNHDYPSKAAHIKRAVENSSVQKILWVSSTSVFADQNQIVTDDMVPQPDTDSGIQLLLAEQVFQNNPQFEVSILRFSGLISHQRHPVFHLSGRENIGNPQAPINLIHLQDCIGIISKILQRDFWGETFNAAAPFHPTREHYYTEKARQLDMPLPQFNHQVPSVGKKIAANRISEVLGYTFAGNLL